MLLDFIIQNVNRTFITKDSAQEREIFVNQSYFKFESIPQGLGRRKIGHS